MPKSYKNQIGFLYIAVLIPILYEDAFALYEEQTAKGAKDTKKERKKERKKKNLAQPHKEMV
ncbi:hypothetical protein VF14_23660 [Nostoc linckia z18]|uniref:Uncharacterized protein n=2 Tax=Nostoc linckia TaxID=92942 RepID=A0A9Q5ZE51_NOSLI|nr:hypothetical protein VF02_33090 [Nostoc linckia z1]PHJ61261.1 hypothetical protein VF03_32500 [Nostoc linckia z2]PHJ66867.1 hypothetical protein VF05_18560 [Nostoc linckia z3]PHJ77555.1 hypothetical protein VF06_29690 [Nostoc linckia z4]PHJ79379.1 hypothetical protein VF07_34050 [Nostoc linckia z6]PHJ92974.1 hypothetical protein VF04_27380 [Nostoc linckia z7]PHK05211.1 hypothetical protein VF08_08460 [Nostoc linckia z8]PHK07562.1 hypothetical protein VF09_23810 [Nostoc linckia z9]PHK1920